MVLQAGRCADAEPRAAKMFARRREKIGGGHGKGRKTPHIGEEAHQGGADIVWNGIGGRPHALVPATLCWGRFSPRSASVAVARMLNKQ